MRPAARRAADVRAAPAPRWGRPRTRGPRARLPPARRRSTRTPPCAPGAGRGTTTRGRGAVAWRGRFRTSSQGETSAFPGGYLTPVHVDLGRGTVDGKPVLSQTVAEVRAGLGPPGYVERYPRRVDI